MPPPTLLLIIKRPSLVVGMQFLTLLDYRSHLIAFPTNVHFSLDQIEQTF